jgi:hypothetical protein
VLAGEEDAEMPFVPFEYTGPIVGYNKGDIHFEKGYG